MCGRGGFDGLCLGRNIARPQTHSPGATTAPEIRPHAERGDEGVKAGMRKLAGTE